MTSMRLLILALLLLVFAGCAAKPCLTPVEEVSAAQDAAESAQEELSAAEAEKAKLESEVAAAEARIAELQSRQPGLEQKLDELKKGSGRF